LNIDNDIAFIDVIGTRWPIQRTDLESTVVENPNNMFPTKNDQSSKYDHNIMTCVCAACV